MRVCCRCWLPSLEAVDHRAGELAMGYLRCCLPSLGCRAYGLGAGEVPPLADLFFLPWPSYPLYSLLLFLHL